MRYKGGANARKNVLGLGDRKEYIPVKLAQYDEAILRKEYSRLRDIAQKRLKRMEKNWSWTEVYKQNVHAYNKLSAIHDKRTLVHKLSQLGRFVTAQTGSASGLASQRDAALKTLHEHGYTFVNKSNWESFSQFMAWAKDVTISRMWDSERVANWWTVHHIGHSAERVRELYLEWMAAGMRDDPLVSAEKAISSTIMRASKAVKAVKRKGKK